MGDMADDLTEQGMDALAAHQAGECGDGCEYCDEGDDMTKQDKLKLCSGCYQNFYNQGDGKECWHLKSARKVRRMFVGTWWNPPYVWSPRETLSCHSPEGGCWIERSDVRVIEKAS